jgi:hypothetical protein
MIAFLLYTVYTYTRSIIKISKFNQYTACISVATVPWQLRHRKTTIRLWGRYFDSEMDAFSSFIVVTKFIFLILKSELFNANSAIFQLYHGESKLIFNEMMMRSDLY